jgi:hypothetical protein
MSDELTAQNAIILYQAENGKIRVEVQFDGETVWLSQALMAELYETTPQNVTQHIREILCGWGMRRRGKLVSNPYKFAKWRPPSPPNDQTLQSGYDIGSRLPFRSDRGTLFRQWARERLE